MLYFKRWQTILIWLAVALSVLYAAPNILPQSFLSSLPSWAPSRPMTLGLDLQGGSHILLQVERQDLVNERLTATRDDVRRLLRDARVGYTGLTMSGGAVRARVRGEAQREAARAALDELHQPIASGLYGSGSVQELSVIEAEPGLMRISLTEEGLNYRLS